MRKKEKKKKEKKKIYKKKEQIQGGEGEEKNIYIAGGTVREECPLILHHSYRLKVAVPMMGLIRQMTTNPRSPPERL